MKKTQALLSIAILASSIIFSTGKLQAQETVPKAVIAEKANISGSVRERGSGEVLVGVSVKVAGTTIGTMTDFNGRFSLSNIPENSVLEFSFIGMKNSSYRIKGNEDINILLESESKDLDEVVVVGYGTVRKRDLTGSIVSLSGESLKTSPDYNPVKSLQGKVPGLSITNSGAAGGSPTIRVRGVATTNAKTDPLYIVDGMFVDNIDFVNPNDIASIEVLKDPSSLAIFGVQGANGVIIITTRSPESGKLSVSYDGYGGSQILHQRDRVNLTNASEFTTLYNEQIKNQNPLEPDWVPDLLGKGTDWLSWIIRPALITNHGITISNAGEKGKSIFSGGYFKQDGIIKYESYQRFNARWAGDYNISPYIKAGGNITLTKWDKEPKSASIENAVRALPTYLPYAPETDHDPKNLGSFYTPSPSIQKDIPNPVAAMEIMKGKEEAYGYRGVGNVYAEFNFLKDFTFKATGYADVGINMGSKYTPRFDVNNASSSSSHKSETTRFSRNTGEYTKYQADFILNYNKKIEGHRINAMLGYTARVLETKRFEASADTLVGADKWDVDKDFWMLSVGSSQTRNNTDSYDSEAFISYLSRLNYSFRDKYILSATFRSDQSSKFRGRNRIGYFPSVGLAWAISEEAFMQDIAAIDFLKLKTAWGKLGNDKIPNYLQYPKINPKGAKIVYNGVTYYLPTQDGFPDPNLHWEIVTGFDAGVEGRFFGQRLALEAGYYIKETSDLLAYPVVPAGVKAYNITNVGSIHNSGFEFVLSWKDKLEDFSYGISLNGASVNNKVLSLSNNNAPIIKTYHKTMVGYPVGALFGYVQDGIFQNQQEIDNYFPAPWKSRPGDIRYKNLSEDGKIDDKDRTYIGSIIPSFTYGFNLYASYKIFDLSVDFNGVAGNSIINAKKLSTFTQFNYYRYALERWTGEGSSYEHPILDNSRAHNFIPSTNLIESGSYLRIRGVQLGCNLPQHTLKRLNIKKARLFINAQNPLTFKRNSGFTPEIGGGILDGGVDNGDTYPIPTSYTAGLTLNF